MHAVRPSFSSMRSAFLRATPSLLRKAAFVTAAVTLSGCGALAGSASACSVSFSIANVSAQSAATSRLTYRAELNDECQAFLAEKSGAAKVKLLVSGVTNDKISLESVSAGERNRSFDTTKFTLAFGSIDTTIDSAIYTDWSLPWADKPTTMSLTLLVPSTLTDSQRPLASATISQ